MSQYAVIGHPIGHTMSPYIHRRLFEISGMSVDYLTLDIPSESLDEVFRSQLKALCGFNITIPHKCAVIPLLDRLDGSAKLYGAVNCVKCGDLTVGYNTDAFGFCTALSSNGVPLSGKVLLLGSGGAARTVAYESVLAGCDLTVAARSQSGRALADEISAKTGKPVKVVSFDSVSGGYDLVVNATPVGMYPNTGVSPLNDRQLDGCKALFDAVYNPKETELIRLAKERGMKTVGGMAMLVWQAVRAHEIWYGASFAPGQVNDVIDGADAQMLKMFGGKDE